MEIKESQSQSHFRKGGGGKQFQFYLSIHPITESYHFSSMLTTLNCISMGQTVLLHLDLSEVQNHGSLSGLRTRSVLRQ